MEKDFDSLLSKSILFFKQLNLIDLKYVRHNNLFAYNVEGYGGREIHFFPPYQFLLEYHTGDVFGAETKFCNWYLELYLKYFDVPKSRGGMKYGSLDTRIRALNFETITIKIINDNQELIMNEIKILVNNKFQLYDSIKERGFNLAKRDRIRAVKHGNIFILKGGHHRVAILKILGLRYVPINIKGVNGEY